MVETAVFAQWIPRQTANVSYVNWRKSKKQQGEVDLVGINVAKQKPEWAVEVKWSDKFYDNPNELASLKYFMQKNKMEYALVTSISKAGKKEMDWGTLQFMPVACYAYTVGRNTVQRTKENYGL